MAVTFQELSQQLWSSTYGIAGACITVIIIVIARLSRCPNLKAFPAVGCDGLFGSWRAGFKYLTNAIDVIQEGYEKHDSAPFKIANHYSWIVILSNRNHLEELRRAPEDQFSFVEAASDRLNSRYTLGDEIHDTPEYHIRVICSQVTRNIETMYSDVRDEIVESLEEVLDLKGEEWKSVPAFSTIQKVVCRSTNRLLVGLPLCRNPNWIDLSCQYAANFLKTGLTIGLFPKFIRPLAARFFTAVARDTSRALSLIGPIIDERLQHLKECGDEQSEMPNDVISWLIEAAEGPQPTAKSLTTRVLVILFADVSTTSNSFTLALFYLAANPQYIQPLRKEVEGIVEKEGWSKSALGKMHKIDSFLKECQRIRGGNALNVMRKAMKDFTFLDGTVIPKGTMIGVPTQCLHLDEKLYKNAHAFQPFRFAEIGEKDSEGAGRNHLASTSIEYQSFGLGKRGCPGRFVAATNMKTMLAHIVTTYDVKLEDGVAYPQTMRFGTWIFSSPSAKVLFRRRID